MKKKSDEISRREVGIFPLKSTAGSIVSSRETWQVRRALSVCASANDALQELRGFCIPSCERYARSSD